MRTIARDGYVFDAGFQVFFPAYPAIRRLLSNDLPAFVRIPSAAVLRDGSTPVVVGAPWDGLEAATGLVSGAVFTKLDLVRLARLVAEVLAVPGWRTLVGPDESVDAFLQRRGFSASARTRFFAPFFGGIFLDRSLRASARTFRYYLRALVLGGAARPIGGIGRIPAALADGLDVRYGTRVVALHANGDGVDVHVDGGGILRGRHVVVATDPASASNLAGVPPVEGVRGATYLTFASPAGIDDERRLILGDGDPVQDAWWISNVDPTAAPPGRAVLTVTVLPPHADAPAERLEVRVRDTLRRWYLDREGEMDLLDVRRIPFAQVVHAPGFMGRTGSVATARPRVTWASDAVDGSSLQGAASSGERAAAAALGDASILGRPRGA